MTGNLCKVSKNKLRCMKIEIANECELIDFHMSQNSECILCKLYAKGAQENKCCSTILNKCVACFSCIRKELIIK